MTISCSWFFVIFWRWWNATSSLLYLSDPFTYQRRRRLRGHAAWGAHVSPSVTPDCFKDCSKVWAIIAQLVSDGAVVFIRYLLCNIAAEVHSTAKCIHIYLNLGSIRVDNGPFQLPGVLHIFSCACRKKRLTTPFYFYLISSCSFLSCLLDVYRWKPASLHSVLAADWQNCPAGGTADEGRQPRRCSAWCRHTKTTQAVRCFASASSSNNTIQSWYFSVTHKVSKSRPVHCDLWRWIIDCSWIWE